MHRFLRAIGFSHIKTRQELEPVLGKIMQEPDQVKKIQLSLESNYTEFAMEFGQGIGIVIRGEYDEKGFFYMQHYFPYCKSRLITSSEDIIVNKRVDTNAFTGMCDDLRIGISLIFYLQNAVDYLELHTADNTPHKAKLTLSGLSLKGTILLGVYHDAKDSERKRIRSSRRNYLITKAKNGDQKAIDDLTLEEIDLSSKIQSRIKQEDLYSIIETTFIPYGSESDHYSILGTIVNWSTLTNSYTGETVCQMLLNCNEILITVCINKEDLLGEPMLGRRFKGVIWMQGHADFGKL
ncbi:MAG: DUF3881 family protein [Lachnospiraceae bacterium]|nr:DUF3881 family protein [Lachnospiraceae bacterium]